jgi:hypothetical protein
LNDYFEFIHSDSLFFDAIRKLHDTKIDLLGEEADGFLGNSK